MSYKGSSCVGDLITKPIVERQIRESQKREAEEFGVKGMKWGQRKAKGAPQDTGRNFLTKHDGAIQAAVKEEFPERGRSPVARKFVDRLGDRHGRAIAEQAEAIINGESLGEQNPNALRYVSAYARGKFPKLQKALSSYLSEVGSSVWRSR